MTNTGGQVYISRRAVVVLLPVFAIGREPAGWSVRLSMQIDTHCEPTVAAAAVRENMELT